MLAKKIRNPFIISSLWLVLSQRGICCLSKRTESRRIQWVFFSHVNYYKIWNSNLDCHNRSSSNNTNQSASNSVSLKYFLRPVLHGKCVYARGKHHFSVVFTSVYHSGGCTCALRRGNTLEIRNAVSSYAEVKPKPGSFYDLELLLNWDGHPSKDSNPQASEGRLCAVLRGVSAGGNHPPDQRRGFELSFYIAPVLWCSSQSKPLFQDFQGVKVWCFEVHDKTHICSFPKTCKTGFSCRGKASDNTLWGKSLYVFADVTFASPWMYLKIGLDKYCTCCMTDLCEFQL